MHNFILSKSALRKALDHFKPMLNVLLAWLFLNILINIDYPAEQTDWLSLLRISPEILMLLGLLCVVSYIGMPFHPAFYIALTALFVFFRLFRIGDVLMPMYFNRPFNLYLDSQYVPDLIHLLYYT
ncbi:MAG TPA: hypothetical protein ENI07_08395, partial [Desulfobacterales bacterium]|nr:hypothetical protein [Desulfobacterales bacterium]